jgi:hypothetical protein
MEIILTNPMLATISMARSITKEEMHALLSDIEMWLMKEKSIVCDDISFRKL